MTDPDALAARRELDDVRDKLLEYVASRLAVADRQPERADVWRLLARFRQARELVREYEQ
jgi:hypothetical protein